MKKIINFFLFVAVLAMAVGCGTAKNFSATSYVANGTGVSMDKNVAYEKAVTNALAEISRTHNVSVEGTNRRVYASTDNNKGNSNETLVFEANGKTNTNAEISDYKVLSEKYQQTRNKWVCNVSISVPIDNVN